MVSSDFKRFIKYSYNLHDSRNSYNLLSSYNLHNSFDKERDKKRRKRRKKEETKDKKSLKILLKKKKKRSVSIIMNVIKIFPGNTKKANRI